MVFNKSRVPVAKSYLTKSLIESSEAIPRTFNPNPIATVIDGICSILSFKDLRGYVEDVKSKAVFYIHFSDKSKRVPISKFDNRYWFSYQGFCYSEALSDALRAIGPFAFYNRPLIIEGETGTGKEVLAKTIHVSSRLPGEFVPVDCPTIQSSLAESELFGHIKGGFTGAITSRKGYIAKAENGTLLLDEIHHLSMEIQSKLLRYLQEGVYKPVGSDDYKKSNARIVAASNKCLKALVKEGLFREDLYNRLNYGYVCLPPLRDQPEAIFPMFMKFVNETTKYAISKDQDNNDKKFLKNGEVKYENELIEDLLSYRWPGNYRELKSCAEKAFISSRWNNGLITKKMIKDFQSTDDEIESDILKLDEMEKEAIEKALKRTRGVIKKAAELLGLPNSTLRDKMDKHEIDIGLFKEKRDEYRNEIQ